MQKYVKKVFALLMIVVLLFGTVSNTVYAAEALPELESAVSNESPADRLMDSEPAPPPKPNSEPVKEPSPEPSAEPSLSPSPTPESEERNIFVTELAKTEARQIWPALQRTKTRAAAGVGTAGVLQMGYYCFKSDVGTLSTLGEYVSQMPAKTMLINGTNIAAYCLQHEKGATGGTPYTWEDIPVKAQETVGTIMALGFQWSAADFWTGPSDNGDKWAVTQLLIWETINGHAFMQGDGLFGVEAAVDADLEKCAPHAYNPTKFLEYYRDLKKRLNEYMKIPAFADKEPVNANVITMRWDGSKYSATVTDTNRVLDNFSFESSIPGVKITANGNSLTLSSSQAILSPITS